MSREINEFQKLLWYLPGGHENPHLPNRPKKDPRFPVQHKRKKRFNSLIESTEEQLFGYLTLMPKSHFHKHKNKAGWVFFLPLPLSLS